MRFKYGITWRRRGAWKRKYLLNKELSLLNELLRGKETIPLEIGNQFLSIEDGENHITFSLV